MELLKLIKNITKNSFNMLEEKYIKQEKSLNRNLFNSNLKIDNKMKIEARLAYVKKLNSKIRQFKNHKNLKTLKEKGIFKQI